VAVVRSARGAWDTPAVVGNSVDRGAPRACVTERRTSVALARGELGVIGGDVLEGAQIGGGGAGVPHHLPHGSARQVRRAHSVVQVLDPRARQIHSATMALVAATHWRWWPP
jgi:hypothetical protein